ncbi:hypothetical protein BKA62DRAFT_675492 [Auriculariales sp. MPI-PUGE-AT-0066]|nr:hypothetical protein BKA62DRAFT_675492 [Auriculariales sp. MPI-PUGE-AT-0066]
MKRGGSNKRKQKRREHVHTIIEGPWLTRRACDKGIGARGRMGKYYRSGSRAMRQLLPLAQELREGSKGQRQGREGSQGRQTRMGGGGTHALRSETSWDERDDSLTTARATRGLRVKVRDMRQEEREICAGSTMICKGSAMIDEGGKGSREGSRGRSPKGKEAQHALKGEGMQALYDEAAETVRGMRNLHGDEGRYGSEGIADFIGRAKHEAFIDPSIRLTTGQVRFNRHGKAEHHKCHVRYLRVMTIRGGSMQEVEGRIPGRIPPGTKPERDRDHQGCADHWALTRRRARSEGIGALGA